jgi:hypothetical protein
MKRLIDNHHEELKKFTNLDFEAVKKVTYLNEFDREVQYVYSAPCVDRTPPLANDPTDVLLGDIPPSMPITEMLHQPMLCWQLESRSLPFKPLMIL